MIEEHQASRRQPVVLTKVHDLALVRVAVLDQHVAVNVRGVIHMVPVAVLGLDQIEDAVAALDPVVAHHGASRAVLQVVAASAALEREDAVELKGDAVGFRVDIVLVDAAHVAVVVDVAALDQHVARVDPAEEAVTGAVDVQVAEGEVRAARREHAGRVIWEAGARAGVAQLKALKHQVGCVSVDVDQAAVVGGVARSRPLAVDHWQLTTRTTYPTENDGRLLGACAVDAEGLAVRLCAPVDQHLVAGLQRVEGCVEDVRVGLARAYLVSGGAGCCCPAADREQTQACRS